MKTVIINGRIVTAEKIIEGNLCIDERGTITSLGVNRKPPPRCTMFDAKGNYILPGLIEVHGHMREPGMTQKEDVPHGTRAALAGGFTTIIDMPNTNPPTVTVDLLTQKRTNIYPNRSYTDYAFFMGVAKNKLQELRRVDPTHIAGIKIFMAGHETTPTTIPDDETLNNIFAIAAKRNIRVALHAEDQTLINDYTKRFNKSKRTDLLLWSTIRPKEVVVRAVERAIRIARRYPNIQLCFLHLSTPEEFSLVAKARRQGLNVSGELVWYHLMFNVSDYKRYGNKLKVAPALRTRENQEAMWQLFKSRKVDTLCSEHTPHELTTKKQGNMWQAQSGMPGIQEMLPALLTQWTKRSGKNSLEEGLMTIAALAAKNPAQIFGFKTKGEITVGKDADFVVVDTETLWKVKKTDLFSKCGWSVFEGQTLIGRPRATFLYGHLVYKDGKVLGKPRGIPLRPPSTIRDRVS